MSRDWSQERSRIGDQVTLPGSVPDRALCEQKPDQCHKGVIVMTHVLVQLFYQVFWTQINVNGEKYVWTWMTQRSGSSSLSVLKLKSFASLVKRYTSHVFTGSLRVVCESHRLRKITGNDNEPKSEHHGTHLLCILRNGCVKEAVCICRLAEIGRRYYCNSMCFVL